MVSGARVRNAYTTYPIVWDSLGKLGVIPDNIDWEHSWLIKVTALSDWCA